MQKSTGNEPQYINNVIAINGSVENNEENRIALNFMIYISKKEFIDYENDGFNFDDWLNHSSARDFVLRNYYPEAKNNEKLLQLAIIGVMEVLRERVYMP